MAMGMRVNSSSKRQRTLCARSQVTLVVILLGAFFAGFCVRGFIANFQLLEPLASAFSEDEAIYPTDHHQDGWTSIEVFYGNTSHLKTNKNRWVSQSGQDRTVSSLLKGKRNGYFVDLAANDPTRYSNTYSLEQKFDWTGLCIEPNPLHWPRLVYRDCQVVAAVVGNQTMDEVQFRFRNVDPIGGHGGIVGESFDNKKAGQGEADPRYTVTLKEIFSRFQVPNQIDYLSLDVEGAEEFIMNHFPFQDYHISLLTIERPKPGLKELLESNGFQMLATMAAHGETMWAHKSILEQLELSALNRYDGYAQGGTRSFLLYV